MVAVDAGSSGEVSIKIAWTVYSRLLRRSLYHTTTSGRAATNHARFDPVASFLEEAFSAAVAELAVDDGFRNTVFTLQDPPMASALHGPERRSGDPDARRAGDAAAREPMSLTRQPLAEGLMKRDAEALVRAAVLIANGIGHGSGFFIGTTVEGNGLILTNTHVAGDAERLRVVLADGTVAIGMVDRRHAPRDVALVRLDRPPPAILAIRETPVRVGEEVYAVGAPLQESLRGTVTRGIVSAVRRDPVTRLPEIQADVAIYGGNSGGPLVDIDGNVIGLSVAGYIEPGGAATGLNLFIPIADALARLNIALAAAP